MSTSLSPGDRVFHRMLRQYGTFIEYDGTDASVVLFDDGEELRVSAHLLDSV